VKLVIVSVLAGAVLAAAPATPRKQTLIGIVSDDMCALAGHASMRMGPTDAECTVACVDAHGAQYVLVVGKDVYTFVDQQQPQKFAGQKVRATGIAEIVKGVKNFRADSVTGIK
jgi:hypothetical protein